MNLPEEPKREDYKTEDEFNSVLAFWRHRVGPLRAYQKGAQAPSPKPEK